MEWIGEPIVERGVREQRFDVRCDGRRVPALLWRPEVEKDAPPVALLGHGGSLHKRADYILATARRLARRGLAAIAIDGPAHGDRRPDHGSDPESTRRDFEQTWQRGSITDETNADWRAALAAVQELLGEGPVGYFGLSMGTMMGVPLVAAEPRIRAAVLGLMGVWGPTRERIAADAKAVRCPVRFLVQWDDEIVPRATALDLFDRLGSREKSLRAHPGRHVQVPPDEMRAVADFLTEHLTSPA
jgi:dienelactone hydrolase